MGASELGIRSLVMATDVDVLPPSSTLEDRGEYVVVRSPSNPSHYWGNFIAWRRPPRPGDGARWESVYLEEFGHERESRHVTFSWDTPTGEVGAGVEEFREQGYALEEEVGLIAGPHELVEHPRANREVEVRQLALDGDEELWEAAVEVQVASREDGHEEEFHRAYVRARMRDRRALFAQGRGGWFLAITPDGEVAASCGVIVTDGRARFQAVDTVEVFRRRGIATRIVHDAARAAIDRYGARQLVICADADYHALPLYESLGFVERERIWGASWWPTAPHAERHPRFIAAQSAG
jgi:GNAT superfamily N-acetyltransferase